MVKMKFMGFRNPAPEQKKRRSRRKKVIERWAKNNVWLWVCAEGLGLVKSSHDQDVQVSPENSVTNDFDDDIEYSPNSEEENAPQEVYSQIVYEDIDTSYFSSLQNDSVIFEVPIEIDTCEKNVGIQNGKIEEIQVISVEDQEEEESKKESSQSSESENSSDEFTEEDSDSKASMTKRRVTRSKRNSESQCFPLTRRTSARLTRSKNYSEIEKNASDKPETLKDVSEKRRCTRRNSGLLKEEVDIDDVIKENKKKKDNDADADADSKKRKIREREDLRKKERQEEKDMIRRKRNPLDYVNKTYKGINKIELQQKLYNESLSLYDRGERRLTRRVIHEINGNAEEPEAKKKTKLEKKIQAISAPKYQKGQIVWGSCQGWWPALIVDPEDVGMVITEPGSLWVFWIGENQITELNAATQIRPFSDSLDSRLVNNLEPEKSGSAKYKACYAVIELFRLKFNFTLTKPFSKWAEKYMLNHKQIDDIRYFPYPERISRKLEELKDINAPKTAKYLLKKEKEKKEKPVNDSSPISSNPETPPLLEVKETRKGYIPLIDQKIGTFVWGKMPGHNWWPAVIVDFKDAGMREPKYGNQWIMWYGDFMLSQVSHDTLWSFLHGLSMVKEQLEKSKKQSYVIAMLHAAKDFASLYGAETSNWTVKDVLDWSPSPEDLVENEDCSDQNNQYRYPEIIWKKLCHRKIHLTVSGPREDEIRMSEVWKKVKKGLMSIDEVCLGCLEKIDDGAAKHDHPYFTGKLCTECMDDLVPTSFMYGEDGKCFFCSLCSRSGVVAMCSVPDCPLVYCTACLKYLIAPECYKDLMARDPWKCFFCEDNSKDMEGGYVKPRPNVDQISGCLFNPKHSDTVCPILNPDGSKRKIRVLSLFDGIATGLLVLEQLGIEIDVYYASEIDINALMVSDMNYPLRIKHLGDVRSIDETKLKEIVPIDLLIGGSPCNDLSIANPNRKGLDDPTGTGVLFYEYLRIKETLVKLNNEHHLFWLFENVASMPAKFRNKISEKFGEEPDVIDSAQFSAMHRPRLYWNNIPIGFSSTSSPDLQDMLDPNCGRSALVKKIRTVTTCSNSLREGKGHSLKPIIMKGKYDVLRVSELERIFGFPRHYTDANLTQTKRLKVLGRAWSVPTIRAMLQPLCNYFSVKK